MLHAFDRQIAGRRGPFPATVESALWTAGAVIATILAIVILFFGVFMARAI
jgi:hypothetical protein